MKKLPKSFILKIVRMMTFQMILLVAVLLLFILFSYHTAMDNLTSASDNLLQIYGRELNNKLDNADILLSGLIYENSDYDMLQSSKESERYYAAIKLKKIIDESISYQKYEDAVVIAESKFGTVLDEKSTSINLNQKNALRKFTLEYAQNEKVQSEWKVGQIGQNFYVYRMFVWQGRAVGIFSLVDNFMKLSADSDFNGVSIFLTDEKKRVWGTYGADMRQQLKGEFLTDTVSGRVLRQKFSLAEGNMALYSYVNMSNIFSQIKLNMILMIGIIVISIISTVILIRIIRKEIIHPMHHMESCMVRMQGGNYELRIEENYGNMEFTMFKDTFNKLMNEIVGLRIASYEKQIVLQETELKCVRLQIRPHFFLNALTTIASLSTQGKSREIEKYIDALSKNIRYIFKSGLHTVPLKEEIQHAESYFEMQELKYPGCVFYSVELESGTEEWNVPQMIIHTIIENEYKYAVSIDSMLMILIKATKVVMQGEELLCLQIEDDGKGYPPEIIEKFSAGEGISEKGSRVGLWSVCRIMELMYERKNLFRIANIEPHGCVNVFYIPAKAVQEVQQDRLQNRID